MKTNDNMTVECPYCGHPNDFSDPERWKDDFKDDAGPTTVECEVCASDFMVQPVLKISLVLDDDE